MCYLILFTLNFFRDEDEKWSTVTLMFHIYLAFPFASLRSAKINLQISSRINSLLFGSKHYPKFVLNKNA